MSGVLAIAGMLPSCNALIKFTFGGSKKKSQPVTMDTSMRELGFAGKALGPDAAVLSSGFLLRCKALTSLDLSGNATCL